MTVHFNPTNITPQVYWNIDCWLPKSPVKLYKIIFGTVQSYGIGFTAVLNLGVYPNLNVTTWSLSAVGTSKDDAVNNLMSIVDQLYQRLDSRREELLATDAESYKKLRVLDTFLVRKQS